MKKNNNEGQAQITPEKYKELATAIFGEDKLEIGRLYTEWLDTLELHEVVAFVGAAIEVCADDHGIDPLHAFACLIERALAANGATMLDFQNYVQDVREVRGEKILKMKMEEGGKLQ